MEMKLYEKYLDEIKKNFSQPKEKKERIENKEIKETS